MALTIEQIIDFQTNGYLIAEDVFAEEDLAPVIEELNRAIDERANELYAQGKITDRCEGEPFETRMASLMRQSTEAGRGFDIMYLLGPAMFEFLHNPKLLDVAECLLGRDVSCNPIQHIRLKTPWKGEGEQPVGMENVPWHQDAAVTTEDSEASEVITFWIPLVDATARTGCMQVIPRSFRRGYLTHQAEGGTTIRGDLMPGEQPVTAECRKGGIVMMNKYTPHRGTSNRSDIVRWSLDLRFHKTGSPSGRSVQPSFVVRGSEEGAEHGAIDYETWCALWREALAKPMKGHHRV
ncbi:MAG: phytanoyl-CoA dioxygenase family protein [Paenibacillaceae bacterium]|nr:phytanoyl-CoA dioxygenase family protein [Paenibacillaceae bacterium]